MRPLVSVRNHHDSGVGVSDAVFHAHNVSKTYNMGEVEVRALHSIRLDLYDGEFLVPLGPSGSGKSTLLNTLGGLVVFQFYNPIPSLTALENVAVVTERSDHPLSTKNALRMVSYGEDESIPAQLSGGEQQRIAVARTIVKHPDLLLCDEPTALDFNTGKMVLGVLEKSKPGDADHVAVIAHNAVIAHMAERVVRLRSDEIVETHMKSQKSHRPI